MYGSKFVRIPCNSVRIRAEYTGESKDLASIPELAHLDKLWMSDLANSKAYTSLNCAGYIIRPSDLQHGSLIHKSNTAGIPVYIAIGSIRRNILCDNPLTYDLDNYTFLDMISVWKSGLVRSFDPKGHRP